MVTWQVRYLSLRDVLREKDISAPRFRLPLMPLVCLILVAACLSAAGSYSGAWEK